ncbi:MAG TPA: homoserine kinase, partial [Xanthobacteraceae bacterium]|nr:homoserine kinase [Xanthobacteraceae bacterium]
MAVYTQVDEEELENFLSGYDLGNVMSFKGIAEGI